MSTPSKDNKNKKSVSKKTTLKSKELKVNKLKKEGKKKQIESKPKRNRIDNFGKNRSISTFKERPQDINKSGANRKLISGILLELKEKGNEPVKPSTIIDAFENLFNLSEAEIIEISEDVKNPYFIRIIAKRMLKDTFNYDVIEKMLDRAHGKAKQSADITSGGEKIENKTIIQWGDNQIQI